MSTGLFSRYHEAVFDFEGAKLELRLRAPLVSDGREIQRKFLAYRRRVWALTKDLAAFTTGVSETAPDAYAVFEETFGEKWAREAFGRLVRVPKDGIAIDEETTVRTGEELFDQLGLGERVAILSKLDDLCFLRSTEGKASASPSTSPVEPTPATDAGVSDATSTGGEGGPRP